MDTAGLRIRFMPLMKKVHANDSTCCLEIVPEVFSLKNFDKIKFKKENNFYEYVIPMNYKIILKRPERKDKDKNHNIDNLDHMYHSCVDLLHPSVTSSSLASGDVNRIVSDNFIHSKVSSDIERCNVILPHSEMCYTNDIKDTVMTSAQTVDAWDNMLSDTVMDGQQNEINAINKIDAQVDSFNNLIENVKELVERGTHTSQETFCPMCIAENNSSDETIEHILSERTHVDSLRKLSRTPVCSITTDASPTTLPHENSEFSNSFFSRDYEPDKEIAIFGNLSPIAQQTFSVYTTTINVDNFKPQYFATSKMLTPEERIEQFMKLMEKEILPLKHMLNDIIAKYSALDIGPNIYNKTIFSEKLHTDKLEEIKRIEEPDKQLQSNRVVLNIVFDG